MPDTTTPKKTAGPRLQHVVAHKDGVGATSNTVFDDVVVFGQELDALRHIIGKQGWVYVAVPHGKSVVEQLKVAN